MPRPASTQPTPGELEVLKVLWERGPGTVRDVMASLNSDRERAYTSVMSLLNVMVDKKLLRRKRSGRAFMYSPRVEERPTLRGMVAELVERAFNGSAKQLVAHALEQTDPSPEELEEIRRLIHEHRAAKENRG